MAEKRNDALDALACGLISVNEARRRMGLKPDFIPPPAKLPRRPKYTNCPNCGAAVNPHKEKCEYCDTYYQY